MIIGSALGPIALASLNGSELVGRPPEFRTVLVPLTADIVGGMGLRWTVTGCAPFMSR